MGKSILIVFLGICLLQLNAESWDPVGEAYNTLQRTVPNIDGRNILVLAATEGLLSTNIVEVKVLDK
jgi:hypothetical protein